MIDAIITFSVRHRGAVMVAGLVLAALGVWAAWDTPVDAIPDLSENQVLVFTEWAGHGPREIEDQVTYPVTLGLRGLAGVRVVRSSSDVGFSTISVIFEDGVAVGEARRRVAEPIGRASRGDCPRARRPSSVPTRLRRVRSSGIPSRAAGSTWADFARSRTGSSGPNSDRSGVAEVASVGGFPIEYEVAPDPDRMRLFGVTLKGIVGAIEGSNAAAAGHVLQKGNAEFVVRGVNWLGASTKPGDDSFEARRAIRDLEDVVLPARGGGTIRLAEVATVAIVPGFRRGVLEKDGNEVVGGVVLMAHGENPLEVTRRIKGKIRELQAGLPPGVRIVPFYDRTPLIEGAVATVTGTVVEAMISASLCVLVILLHVRTSLVIAGTLPLAALSSFLIMAALRRSGVVDIPANAMSLAGIAISIGVLVDSSVVMAENVMHRLKERFGDEPVRGDVRDVVLPACLAVGRPIVFSVGIMVLSFLPVFALGGIEGKMFHPLAYTKTFALASVAVLAVTLVPALCTLFIRGRLRSERENPLVRGVIEVYRPVLSYLMDRPAVLAGILGVTFLLGFAPMGSRPIFLGLVALAIVATAMLARSRRTALLAPASLIVIAMAADRGMTPLGREFMTPLDEGMVMDMPITVPRASVTESVDDLKARDMVLCRFPEVDMVVGKAGRAETPTDPAPMDMIETMVNFRPRAFWPRRKLHAADARRQAAGGARRPAGPPRRRCRRSMRRHAGSYPRRGGGGGLDAVRRREPRVRLPPQPGGRTRVGRAHAELAASLRSGRGLARAAMGPARRAGRGGTAHARPPLFTRLVDGAAPRNAQRSSTRVAEYRAGLTKLREEAVAAALRPHRPAVGGHHHHGNSRRRRRSLEPQPILDAIQSELAAPFGRRSSSGRRPAKSWPDSAANWTLPCRCRAGRTSGRCRSRTGSICSRPA